MAASSIKDIKLRIKSVESTMQITKAMELVASSKLRRAKMHAERTRPYFTTLHETLTEIAYGNTEFASPYVAKRELKKVCYVVIAGDRGLAGGYNSNLLKTTIAHMDEQTVQVCALPIGKKALEYCTRQQMEILTDVYNVAGDISLGECAAIGRLLCTEFCARKFDAVYICYTNFVSMLSQQPAVLSALPLKYNREAAVDSKSLTLYEPSCEAVYDAIVPEYITGLLYGALAESIASEQGARRTAMDAASKNADEMIGELSLKYNRARQGAITQELTEIVAGAEA